MEWAIPQDSLFQKQKLQVKIEQDRRLNVTSSPWSFFCLFFTDTILNHITFETNLYDKEISYGRCTKPVHLFVGTK